MRLEVDDASGVMSVAATLKYLNRLNSRMEAGDPLRQAQHHLAPLFPVFPLKPALSPLLPSRHSLSGTSVRGRSG